MHDLAERIREHYDSIASPVTVDEILGDRTDTFPVGLFTASVDLAGEPVEAKAETCEACGADIAVFDLRGPVERPVPAPRKRRAAILGVAAAILLVAGVVVVAERTDDNLVTEPVTSAAIPDAVPSPTPPDPTPPPEQAGPPPSVLDPVSSYRWSRVATDDAAVFGDGFGQEIYGVTVGGPGFVAVGQAGPGGVVGGALTTAPRAAVWTSVDGIDWSRVPHDEAVFGAATMSSVTVGGPGLVAVGSATSDEVEGPAVAAVWTSVDGFAWSRVPHDEAVFGEAVFDLTMTSVTAGGSGLVAVGFDGCGQCPGEDAVVWTSPDGIDWSRILHDDAIFGAAAMSSVTVGGPGLVAVGSTGPSEQDAAVWISADGVAWSRVPQNEALSGGSMNSVTVGGPGLVAVGSTGSEEGLFVAAVWTSVDGIDWSRVPHDEAAFGGKETRPACCGGEAPGMRSVTVGGPGLVAVGSDFMRSVTFADDRWVIVAAVWTSVDGVTWSRVPHDEAVFAAPPRPNLSMTSITAGGPRLVAVGANTVHDYWATHNDSGEADAATWVATFEG